ncbi:unnamed protein product [Peniophora sp. CBMAI 1063]|nr:unnamed protein product [Peniophora sp. CBMAI 1063]
MTNTEVPEIAKMLAKLLDRFERGGIYNGLEKDKVLADRVFKKDKQPVIDEFKRVGFGPEPDNAGEGRICETMETVYVGKTSEALKAYRSLIVLRLFDLLSWASGAPKIPQNSASAKSGELRTAVKATFGEGVAEYLNDWTSALTKAAEGIRIATAQTRQSSTELDIDWTRPEITLPVFDQVLSTLSDTPSVGSLFTSVYSANIKCVAFAICYLLNECDSSAGDLSQLDLTKLRNRCSPDQSMARGIWNMLVLALFVSPLPLLSHRDLATECKSIQLPQMLEYWVQLGNLDRPRELAHAESLVWSVIFSVAGGGDAMVYTSSLAEYWLSGPSTRANVIETRRWFVAGLPASARTSGSSAGPSTTAGPNRSQESSLKRNNTADTSTGSRPPKVQKTEHTDAISSKTSVPGPSNDSNHAAQADIEPSGAHVQLSVEDAMNWLLEENKSLTEKVQKKDAEIEAIRREKTTAESLMLARCLELLNGEPEQIGVQDISGALGSLGKMLKRLRADSAASKKDATVLRLQAQESYKKLQSGRMELNLSRARARELEGRLQDRAKVDQAFVKVVAGRIESAKP